MSKKMFDFCIGNPPYNSDFQKSGDNGKYAAPVYDKFMNASYTIADSVELIHPARFLFNAGSTNKKWNEKMLNDPHFKVLEYEPKSDLIFPNTDIKGGVAITYHNIKKSVEPIHIFTPFEELNRILKKVSFEDSKGTFAEIISGRGVYKLSSKAIIDYPEIEKLQSKGHVKDIGSGAFKILKNIIFFKELPDDNEKYVKFLGLDNKTRTYWWGKRDYIDYPESFCNYKVFLPKANGSGALGEVLSTPLIGEPLIGATETFLSIGNFNTKYEAESCMKYMKSKFARVMLGILKTTQDNTKAKWKYVPLQDFTDHSDIDWSKSIPEIDQQLYKKYGLSNEEIDFIETHVKEMK